MRFGVASAWIGCISCWACSVVTPPPMALVHDPVLRPRPGSVSVAAAGGGGGGVFLDHAAGGEGRVTVQVAEEWAIEASGGAGTRTEDHDGDDDIPDVLAWGRVGARYQPARLEWFAVRFGAGGGGADTGLAYATLDSGVVFGYTLWRRVRPYAGLSVAVALPVRPGPFIRDDLIPRRPETTLWAGLNAGITIRVVGSLEVGGEYLMHCGWSSLDETALALGGTGILRYVFEP